jgi:tetratricopeptide (TPR) repeat protein/O-antigen ligase
MNKFLRYTIIGGIFASLFLPLFISNSVFFPFISGKNFAFRIIVEVILASWVLLMFRIPEYRPRASWISKALIIFVVVLAIADIFAINPYKAFWSNFERMEGLLGFLHLLGYFFVVSSVVRTEKLWGALFHTSIGVSIFTCLYAILQAGGELAINQGGLRVDATFGNAIYLAVYLLFHLFLVKKRVYGPKEIFKSVVLGTVMFLGYYLVRIGSADVSAHTTGVALSIGALVALLFSGYMLQSNKEKVVARSRITIEWLMIVLYIIVIGYTATRGVVIGLAASLVVMGILLVFAPSAQGSEKYRKIGAGILVALVLSGIGFFVLRGIPAVRDNKILGRLASISLNNDDAQARFRIWSMALQGFKERPVFGWGQEGFNYVFNKYYDPKMYAREQWFDRTHNVFFDWLIAGGLLGLLGYLFIYLAFLRHVWKSPKGDATDSNPHTLSYVEKVILTAVIAGYFMQNFFVFDNLTSYLMFFLLLSYVHFVSTSGTLRRPAHAVSNDGALQIVPAIVIIALVFSLYFFNARPIMAGKKLIRSLQQYPLTATGEGGPKKNLELFKEALAYHSFADAEIREQLAQLSTAVFQAKNADEGLKASYFELGYSELKKQLEQTPEDARYELFMGVFLNAAGRFDEGISHLEKASKLSPAKQSILFELGTSYLNNGKFDQALAIFKKAFELEPEFTDARIIYALGANYAGQYELADKILTDGFGDALNPDPRLVQSYVNRGRFDRIAEVYIKLTKTDPLNTDNYVKLAGAYLQLKQRAKATEAIKKAIEIDPTFKEAGEGYLKEISTAKL